MGSEIVLLVDDEVNVLSSLSRTLGEEDFCQVKTAKSGQEALEIVKAIPEIAVIISDYHMPGMTGIEFLTHVRAIMPDVTRMILTGAGDLEMAVEAVNRGNIFRFLLKPCPPDMFIATIKEGIKQYHLITGERVLLSKTLNGSIKVLIDILAAIEPEVFARATRLRNLARGLVKALKVDEQAWEVELAAILSQIGAVTIPQELLRKWRLGSYLTDAESAMIKSIPQTGRQLISNIPRLENIADAVGFQDCVFSGSINPEKPGGKNIPLIARILKVIIDYDRFKDDGYGAQEAFEKMQQHGSEYDPEILYKFGNGVLGIGGDVEGIDNQPVITEKEILVIELKTGMTLLRDVLDKKGRLIVPAGTIVNDVIRYRLINFFQTQSIVKSVLVEAIE